MMGNCLQKKLGNFFVIDYLWVGAKNIGKDEVTDKESVHQHVKAWISHIHKIETKSTP